MKSPLVKVSLMRRALYEFKRSNPHVRSRLSRQILASYTLSMKLLGVEGWILEKTQSSLVSLKNVTGLGVESSRLPLMTLLLDK